MVVGPALPVVVAALVAATPVAPPVPGPTDDVRASEQATLDVAMAAFDVGLDAYEHGDYTRAIASWTSAHRLLVARVDDTEMQRVLGFDLAQAHLRQHPADHDPAHLDRARPLLEDYITWLERPGHALTPAEKRDLDHALELLALVEIEQAAAIADRRGSPYPPGPAPPPPPAVARDAFSVPPPPDPVHRLRRDSNTWLIAGSASLGLALAFGATVGVLAREPNGQGSGAGIAAATTGTVLLGGVGIAALTIGLAKRHKLVHASPTLSKTGFGATMRLAF